MPEWGGWWCDPRLLVLFDAENGYEVDLAECTSSAEVLDWTIQLAGKGWVTAIRLAGLVHAFDVLLHPQATLCPNGSDQRMTRREVARRVRRTCTSLRDRGEL